LVAPNVISKKVYPPLQKGAGGIERPNFSCGLDEIPLTPLLQKGGLVGSFLEYT